MKYKSSRGFRYIFGPVPSRRLGRSLGIDIIPAKTCTFDCVYCECGKTSYLTVDRQPFINPESVLNELQAFLSNSLISSLDAITFSGTGEPTLCTHIGLLIREIKRLCPSVLVGVLTNGSLLWDADVRKSLLAADFVIPSLDAPSPNIWYAINRPHSALSWEMYIEGLTTFRRVYQGQYVLEVFFIRGINDSFETLNKFLQIFQKINPDTIDLNTLARPGTEPDILGLDEAQLERICHYFEPFPCRIIGRYKKHYDESYKNVDDSNITELILAILVRRPCTAEDMADSLGLPLERVLTVLKYLVDCGVIRKHSTRNQVFYSTRSA